MEVWDIYDACFEKTGKTKERGKELLPGEFHFVVHIFPVNEKGELLIQKRSETVEWRPGIWAATGGSAIQGESMYEACIRELYEELGIVATKETAEMAALFKKHTSFHSVWIVRTKVKSSKLRLQPEEVSEAKWVSIEELRILIEEGRFYSYHYMEWLFHYIKEESILCSGNKEVSGLSSWNPLNEMSFNEKS